MKKPGLSIILIFVISALGLMAGLLYMVPDTVGSDSVTPFKVSQTTQNEVMAKPQHLQRGFDLYRLRCLECHQHKPIRLNQSFDYYLYTIQVGRDGQMPPWKDRLQDKDIINIAAYIYYKAQEAAKKERN